MPTVNFGDEPVTLGHNLGHMTAWHVHERSYARRRPSSRTAQLGTDWSSPHGQIKYCPTRRAYDLQSTSEALRAFPTPFRTRFDKMLTSTRANNIQSSDALCRVVLWYVTYSNKRTERYSQFSLTISKLFWF